MLRLVVIAALALAWGVASFEIGHFVGARSSRPATFDERFGTWPEGPQIRVERRRMWA